MKKLSLIVLVGLCACGGEKAPEPIDCDATGPSAVLDEKVDASCGQDDGTFSVTVAGGTGTLTYTLNGSAVSAAAEFTGLAAGTYALVVKDENACQASLNVTIGNADGVNIQSATATNSGCGTSNGTITVTANSGDEPYTYKLGTNAFQASNSFAGLARGSYTVTVRDESGCEASSQVQVLSGVSYQNSVKSIIDNNCSVSGCHGQNSAIPNFSTIAGVQARAQSIKSHVINGTMPPSPSSISQANKDLIACWVDDGALNN